MFICSAYSEYDDHEAVHYSIVRSTGALSDKLTPPLTLCLNLSLSSVGIASASRWSRHVVIPYVLAATLPVLEASWESAHGERQSASQLRRYGWRWTPLPSDRQSIKPKRLSIIIRRSSNKSYKTAIDNRPLLLPWKKNSKPAALQIP